MLKKSSPNSRHYSHAQEVVVKFRRSSPHSKSCCRDSEVVAEIFGSSPLLGRLRQVRYIIATIRRGVAELWGRYIVEVVITELGAIEDNLAKCTRSSAS